MATTRIYIVKHGATPHLVRASSAAQARNHVADRLLTVAVASQDDCLYCAGRGIAVEEAGLVVEEQAAA